MPSNDILARFTQAALERMVAPIQRYYDVIDQYGSDSTQALVALSIARTDLERAVRQNHIDAGLIGAAGNLSPDARGVLQDIISTDTYYVERFADDLPRMSRAQALVRANLYVNTQRNTITDVTSLELPTLPIYPRDSRLQCEWHCKCSLDPHFLYGNGNADVYWKLDPMGREHCPDCLRLASSWRPLRIRNGVIVGAKMVNDHDIELLQAVFERMHDHAA